MEKIIALALLLGGCATVEYREVKVPVSMPCQAGEPVVYQLPIEGVNELTVRDAIARKSYGEVVYSIGSSLILLNGDVKAYREVLGSCR